MVYVWEPGRWVEYIVERWRKKRSLLVEGLVATRRKSF